MGKIDSPIEINYKNLNKTIIYTVVYYLVVFISCFFLFQYSVHKYLNYSKLQMRTALVEKVTIALDVINPLREDYKRGKLTKAEAIENCRQIVKRMVFEDENGKNYIFLANLDGISLASPLRPEEEFTNLTNIPDSKGNHTLRNIIKAVKRNPDGAFTEYIFPHPKTRKEELKLSYAVMIPELGIFLGTGTFMNTYLKSQFEIIRASIVIWIIIIVLILLPLISFFVAVLSRNRMLKNEILKRVQISEELKIKEEDLSITLKSIGDGVIATDRSGIILRLNPVAEHLTGWKSEDAIGRLITDVLKVYDSETGELCENPVENVLVSDGVIKACTKTILVSRNNMRYNVSNVASPIKNAEGEIRGVVFVIRDITEESKLREEAKQKEEIFRIIFNTSPYGVTIAELETGRYIITNNAHLEATGYTEEETIGKTPLDLKLYADDTPYLNFIEMIKEKQFVHNYNSKIYSKKREVIHILFSAKVIDFMGKKCLMVISSNVTEMVNLQEQLNHARKMDAIGHLAGGIAHDFNNMLGAIMNATELMEIYKDDTAQVDMFKQMIYESAERASSLTSKLLAFARKGKIESTPVDVHKAVNDAVELLRSTIDKKIEISLELKAEHFQVTGDISQLMNIFLNLGINSSHAMVDGGKLKFSSKIVELDESFCDATTFHLVPGSYILVEVEDTGCGIPTENLEKIFDPFFTTKEQGKGTGLGLASVFGSIQEHHGMVAVYSEVGKGTTFHIYLPLSENVAYSTPIEYEFVKGNGSILIIDDEDVIRITAKTILEYLGYEVFTARNGKEGLETYKQRSETIDLVILDMIMPEMNGKDCFIAIRAINSMARVIISSGFSKEEDVKELMSRGLAGFIRKPFHTLDLSKIVSEVLSSDRK